MNNTNISGKFTITCTDTVTGVTRVVNKGNAIVNLARNHIPKNTASSGFKTAYCHISDDKHVADSKKFYSTYMKTRNTTRLALVLGDPTVADVVDFYFERGFRFDSTGTANTVNTISIDYDSGSNTYVKVEAYTVLNSPFVQGASEVMDITYRITFNTTALTPLLGVKWANFLYNIHDTSALTDVYTYITDTHVPKVVNDSFTSLSYPLNTVTDGVLENFDTSLKSYNYSDSLIKTDIVGYGLKSIVQVDYNADFKTNNYAIPITTNPVFKDNSVIASYPLSPLFNHAWDAGNIFEDVDKLATGLGYPIVSTTSPTYLDGQAQEQYIFTITKSGNTGTARYDFVYKSTVGRVDVNNNNNNGTTNLEQMLQSFNHTSTGLFHTSLTDATLRYMYYPTEYAHKYDSCFEYNADWTIYLGTSDSNLDIGLLFLNQLNPELTFGFDKGTTPALNTGLKRAVNQLDSAQFMTRDNAGNIYVCVSTGLMKISDPLGTPTITYQSLVALGFTTEPLCIDILNNNLYILSADKISVSSNLGVSYTTNTITMNATVNNITALKDTNYVVIGYLALDATIWNITTDTLTHKKASSHGIAPYSNIQDTDWLVLLGVNQNNTSSTCYQFLKNDGSNVFDINIGSRGKYQGRIGKEWVKDGLDNDILLSTFINLAAGSNIFVNMDQIMGATGKDSITYLGEDYRKKNTNRNLTKHSELDGIPYLKASMHNRAVHYDNSTLVSYGEFNKTTNNTNIFNTPEHETNMKEHFKNRRAIIHRWDGSAWVAAYNKPTDATGDGSSSLTAIRRNFDTDSNRFNSGCSLDISAAVDTASYATNGMMILMTVTGESKNVGGFSSSDWRLSTLTSDSENPITCLCEVTDTVSKRSVALLTVGYNDKAVLVDSTDPTNPTYHDLEIQPVNGQYRYAMSISSDGTTVKVYRDASQLGTTRTLTNVMNMASTYEFTIGSRNRSPMDGVHNLGANYKGKIENIQVFNTILTSGELSNDSGTPLGLTAPTANLVVRYLMTMDYGEGKVTHSADNTTINGVNIRFPDGDLSNDSYVKSDNYLVYKIKDGFIKDNTSTFDMVVESSVLGSIYSTVTSPIDGSSTIPAASAIITERADFNSIECGSSNNTYGMIGDISVRAANYAYSMMQSTTVDLIAVFTLGLVRDTSAKIRLGNVSNIGSTTYSTNTNFTTAEFTTTGDLKLYDETSTLQTIASVATPNSKFKLEWVRSTGISKMFKWDGAAWVQQGTDMALSAANAGTVTSTIIRCASTGLVEFADFTVTHTPDNLIMRVGDKTTATGAYDIGFLQGTQYVGVANTVRVTLDGVTATANFIADTNLTYQSTVIPAIQGEPPVGDFNYYPQSGLLQFNSADAGKVVAINEVYLEVL